MKVDSDMNSYGSASFANPSFRWTIESHIPYLLSLATTRSISVDPHATIVYNQDLYGYLLSIGVQPCYHWITMRVNGMFSPTEFNSNSVSVLVPNSNELESIRQSWAASTVIKS